MPKYHYNVHVISKADDFSMWVGVTIDHKQLPQGDLCLDNSLLGMTAIARARELCPALKECFCEEWNGGDEVEDDPVQKFLGADYTSKMAILKAAIKPLLTALDQTHMQLAVDHRCEYWLTAIPWREEYAGGMPEGMDTGKLLDATMALGDAQHLVAVID
jgi:hypothetical protein